MAKDEMRFAHIGADRPHVKVRYRSLFLALHAAALRHPGGITAMARVLGRNGQVMANQLNPNDGAIPPADVLLSVIELAGAVEALNALAWLLGCTTVPIQAHDRAPREVMAGFLALMQRASAATQAAAQGLEDGRLDHEERTDLLPLLDQLIAAAVEFRAVVQPWARWMTWPRLPKSATGSAP